MTNGRTVNCLKLKKELQGLPTPPFKGQLGQRIYENISQEAWDEWNNDVQTRIINEYRLNLASLQDYQYLLDEMCLFLNLPRN